MWIGKAIGYWFLWLFLLSWVMVLLVWLIEGFGVRGDIFVTIFIFGIMISSLLITYYYSIDKQKNAGFYSLYAISAFIFLIASLELLDNGYWLWLLGFPVLIGSFLMASIACIWTEKQKSPEQSIDAQTKETQVISPKNSSDILPKIFQTISYGIIGFFVWYAFLEGASFISNLRINMGIDYVENYFSFLLFVITCIPVVILLFITRNKRKTWWFYVSLLLWACLIVTQFEEFIYNIPAVSWAFCAVAFIWTEKNETTKNIQK